MTAEQARALLAEVIDRGAPAQADFASELQQRWKSTGTQEIPAELVEPLALVADAHLNDPYLTRRERDHPGE